MIWNDTADRHYLGTQKLVVPKPGEWLSNVSRLFLVRSLSRPLGEVFQGDRFLSAEATNLANPRISKTGWMV